MERNHGQIWEEEGFIAEVNELKTVYVSLHLAPRTTVRTNALTRLCEGVRIQV